MNKQIFIKGVAINEGISRNNIMYSAAELSKFAPTLRGKPILKDHESKTDNTIGRVTDTLAINDGKSVIYEGWIKEDGTGIVERIEDKRITEVSIGAIAKRLVREKDSDILIAEDITAMELSTTPTPGVLGTSLGIRQSLSPTNHIPTKEKTNLSDERRSGKMTEENMSKEVQELKENNHKMIETNSKMVEELTALRNQIRESKINEYKKLCAEKKVKELDMSKSSSETIDFAISQLQVVEVAMPIQTVAKSEMKSVIAEKKDVVKDNLVIEASLEGKGFSIWEMPDKAKWRKLHNDLPYLSNGR